MAGGIPVTYVPARNTIFLAFALALAERLEASDIFFGANQLDYSGYPDCREEYIRAFETMANLATKAGVEGKSRVKIHVPLIELTKAQIIRKGIELGINYGLTWSCYDPAPDGRACGLCDSCQLRLKGFREAGLDDPIAYVGSLTPQRLNAARAIYAAIPQPIGNSQAADEKRVLGQPHGELFFPQTGHQSGIRRLPEICARG